MRNWFLMGDKYKIIGGILFFGFFKLLNEKLML